MIDNTEFFIKAGESDIPISVTLKEANGQPIDLTGWSIQMKIAKQKSSTVLLSAAMIVDGNQVTNKGKAAYTFTGANIALFQKGDYDLEFVATIPGGSIRKFPKDPNIMYATLHVLGSK